MTKKILGVSVSFLVLLSLEVLIDNKYEEVKNTANVNSGTYRMSFVNHEINNRYIYITI